MVLCAVVGSNQSGDKSNKRRMDASITNNHDLELSAKQRDEYLDGGMSILTLFQERV